MCWYSARRRSCPTHWLTDVVRYFSQYVLTALMIAMIATAATAKFSVAYLSPPRNPDTTPPIQPGSFFDCTMLSMTILMGHGWRMSAIVSPNTATSASVSAFQCGRRTTAVHRFAGWRASGRLTVCWAMMGCAEFYFVREQENTRAARRYIIATLHSWRLPCATAT